MLATILLTLILTGGVLLTFITNLYWGVIIFTGGTIQELLVGGPWAIFIFMARLLAIYSLYRWGMDHCDERPDSIKSLTPMVIITSCTATVILWLCLYIGRFFLSESTTEIVFSLPLELNIICGYILNYLFIYFFKVLNYFYEKGIAEKVKKLWQKITTDFFGWDISGLLMFIAPIATGAILISGLWQLMKHDPSQGSAGILIESSWTKLYPATTSGFIQETQEEYEYSTEPKEIYTNFYSTEEPYCIDDIAIVWGNYWFVPDHPDKSYKTTEYEYTEWITKRYGEPDKVIVLADNKYVNFGEIEAWNIYGWLYLGDYPCVLSAYPYP